MSKNFDAYYVELDWICVVMDNTSQYFKDLNAIRLHYGRSIAKQIGNLLHISE